MSTAPAPSIHFRRRWYYALWVSLLLLSAGALVLWERPASTSEASLVVKLDLPGAPAGCRIQAWVGPWAQGRNLDWGAAGLLQADLQADGQASLPLVRVRIARRRWVPDYIPRATWDLMVLRIMPPAGPPKFYCLPLSEDIRSGVLRAKWRLTTVIQVPWDGLQTDARLPDRIP